MPGLVFVPLAADELRAWAESGRLSGPFGGYAVTAAMAAAFGFDDLESEDAEYTALCVASIAGLIAHGIRLVAVARAAHPPSEDEFGKVVVNDLPFSAVSSLFGEDTDRTPAAAAARAVAGCGLGAAWEAPEIAGLLADTDLLWYGPGEWPALTG